MEGRSSEVCVVVSTKKKERITGVKKKIKIKNKKIKGKGCWCHGLSVTKHCNGSHRFILITKFSFKIKKMSSQLIFIT